MGFSGWNQHIDFRSFSILPLPSRYPFKILVENNDYKENAGLVSLVYFTPWYLPLDEFGTYHGPHGQAREPPRAGPYQVGVIFFLDFWVPDLVEGNIKRIFLYQPILNLIFGQH